MMTFSTAYMLDLGFSMTKITLIIGLQVAINLGMLLIMGRITDHFGARLPLILIPFLLMHAFRIAAFKFGVFGIILLVGLLMLLGYFGAMFGF